MDINELLKGIKCSCGRNHTCDIKYVYVEKNAAFHLPKILADYSRILLVADENTYAAAGAGVEKYIGKKIVARQIFTGSEVLIPNEDAIDAVKEHLSGCDFIIGVGSGVIQDLCKYVSFFNGVPYAVVATAPSMDGYASSGAAMITDGMKVTYSARVPMAILADTDVLKNAPLDMIKAGYGDIVGKFSALNDWKLSAFVNGENICDYIYGLTFDMLKSTLPLAEKLLQRDGDSVRILTEALVVVGIAMSFAGSSRPASGSEHHLSHFFEITGIIDGTAYFPHGIDVLYSTYETARVRRKLISSPFPKKGYSINPEEYYPELSKVYKSISDGCIALQEKTGSYTRSLHSIYQERENEIKQILGECPTPDEILGYIEAIGLDISEFYAMYGEDKICDAVRYAKELKDRYTVLWTYFDMYGTEKV